MRYAKSRTPYRPWQENPYCVKCSDFLYEKFHGEIRYSIEKKFKMENIYWSDYEFGIFCG